jgi:hypothetical protein
MKLSENATLAGGVFGQTGSSRMLVTKPIGRVCAVAIHSCDKHRPGVKKKGLSAGLVLRETR